MFSIFQRNTSCDMSYNIKQKNPKNSSSLASYLQYVHQSCYNECLSSGSVAIDENGTWCFMFSLEHNDRKTQDKFVTNLP